MEIFVLRDGQQTGPFNSETLQTLCQRGGLSLQDMAWHQGLPGWLPLAEVLNPGSERPSAPPPTPVSSGIRPAPKKSATAKQKALLKYLGASVDEDVTKEDAAVAISDALDNPKYTAKFQKWGDERLKQHPDLYQDEIDYRRAHRVARYLERCQTEASEAVTDVTKAHIQVLVESLDKKNPNWERDPKDALWNHLLPAISDHFPQLVQEKYRNRLRPAPSKVARAMATSESALPPEEAEPAPGVFSAAIRGLLYGGVVLGLILGANYLFKKPDPAAGGKPTETKTTPANPTASAPAPVAPPSSTASTAPAHPSTAPVVNATPDAAAPAVPPAAPEVTPAPAPPVPTAPAPAPTPAADPTMTPNADPAMAGGTPPAAPALLPAPAPGIDVPAAAAPGTTPGGDPVSGGFKSVLTVTKPVAVQLQFGKVTLNTGTRVRFIALEGPNVRVNFNNNVILVPAIATDVDPTAVPPAPAPAPATAPVAPPAPAPVATPAPTPATPKPSSDL